FVIDELYTLLFTRFLVGFATAAFSVVSLGILVVNSAGHARNRWLGYMNIFTTIATPILVPIAAYAGNYGWHWPFLIHAFVLPLMLLSLIGFPPDAPRVRKETTVTREPLMGRLWAWLAKDMPWGFLLIGICMGAILITPN